ncbi:unnamed protein product [Rotaria sp. Silwood2]|nr:unnamed protein product [Rotaria sp. Silwood2]CAF2992328.1 unnamed protein product [Rotaria sp. Silwood2]CAF3885856.1 unnamed protein product [Rotaria sp. Silwood2]CAF4098590.1 unnamed protein product [Rotaria sp. Silwood2]
MSSSSPYTCITCHVAFINGELQRAHYKTDWHRYNLKRKVADLGPITANEFTEKVETIQQQQHSEKNLDTNNRTGLTCKDCGKAFTSENGLLNHIKSKKHIDTVAKHANLPAKNPNEYQKSPIDTSKEPPNKVDMEEEAVEEEEEEEEGDNNDDDDDWNDMDDGATMTNASAMEGEPQILGTPLCLEECLFCSLKSSNLEENLSHMAYAHSFFFPDFEYIKDLPGLIEYLDEKVGIFHVCLWCNKKSFHDVLSVQRHMTDKGHCKILFDENPNAAWEYVDFYDYSMSHPDSNEKNLDEEIDENILDTNGYELVLPSGKKVGHRTLVRYYRQSLTNRNNERSLELVNRIKDKYRALGWSGPGTTGEVFQRKVRDLKYMQQWKAKQHMRLGIKRLYPSTSIICSCRVRQLLTKQIYSQSTTVLTTDKHEKKNIRTEFPLLDTRFNQYQIAYRYRRSIELLRGYLVYRLFSINFIVNHQTTIAEWGQRILGSWLFNNLLKVTAFGHFVGGETAHEITPVIRSLLKYGVKPILDYSVESDDTSKSSSSEESDRMHDHNTSKFIECIKTSHDICGVNNLIAIKVTALIRPGVLKKLNALLKSIENRSLLPPLFEFINQEQKSENMAKPFQQSIKSYLAETKVLSGILKNKISTSITLTNDELTEIYNLLIRLNRIAQACVEQKISIMVDAEQTYFQTAINYIANELQRYYNKNNEAFIYGTYQCYLKEALTSVRHDLAQAEKYNYVFAAKLVRGAYMDRERQLAQQYGYEDPINVNFEATSKMYHACFDEVLKSAVKRNPDQIRVMVASHNEDTIRYAIKKMQDYNINHDSPLILFSSLYGMSDYVAFALANSGYKTYKYLPYGPIESLQPYLFRRAQENRTMFEKADKDRRLHFKAFKDRVLHLKM